MKMTWSDSWFRGSILGPEWDKGQSHGKRDATEEAAISMSGEK